MYEILPFNHYLIDGETCIGMTDCNRLMCNVANNPKVDWTCFATSNSGNIQFPIYNFQILLILIIIIVLQFLVLVCVSFLAIYFRKSVIEKTRLTEPLINIENKI